jgi:hypothetical protein
MSPVAPTHGDPDPSASASPANSLGNGPLHAHPGDRKLHVSYELRFSDLYWMWETSPGGLIGTVVLAFLGLVFLSVVLTPADHPVAADVAVGILFLLLAPIFVPIVMLFASGKVRMLGRPVRITIDGSGVEGWSVPAFRETTWARLSHPRLESRVLVLPFSWPFADSWVVVPARAFTPTQFERWIVILEAEGWFRAGDRRSLFGRMVSRFVDRGSVRHPESTDGRLARFPTFRERHS